MHFSMHTPCRDCPWRSDIDFHLHPKRVVAILSGVLQDGETFTCHHTISGRRSRTGYEPGPQDQHCAGMLVLIHKEGIAHSLMQIAERLGLYDPTKLDRQAPVYETVEALLERYEALEEATALLAWLNKPWVRQRKGDGDVE